MKPDSPAPIPYADHFAYLAAGLNVLRLRIERLALRRRAAGLSEDGGLRAAAPDKSRAPRGLVRVESEWKAARAAHHDRTAASLAAGVALPLEALAREHGLDAFAKDIMRIALAPSVDPGFCTDFQRISGSRFYSPAVRDFLDLFCDTPAARVAARAHFDDTAPLFADQLLQANRGAEALENDFLDVRVEMPRATADRLLGAVPVAPVEPSAADGKPDSFSASPATPAARLADVVLPERTRRQVAELIEAVRRRGAVLDDWGLGGVGGYGRGVTALFSGPSGVGKTLTAAAVAGELGVPLRAANLSELLDRWHGGTEKNLEAVFKEARETGALLFFDEAESLFGARCTGAGPHAHAYNHQINYLLTALERHEGAVILATNRAERLDPAFERRLGYRVAFEPPDEAAREALWRAMVSPKTPLAADVDFAALARRYAFAGGTIRNVLLRAATVAAAEGGALAAKHLEAAARDETPLDGPPRRLGFARAADRVGE